MKYLPYVFMAALVAFIILLFVFPQIVVMFYLTLAGGTF